MAHPTTLKEWQALTGEEALNDAEKQLIEACRAGDLCELGDCERPDGPDPNRTIRATILRWLILGGGEGCHVHEWGVFLYGAFVDGYLDLSYSEAHRPTALVNCHFNDSVSALGAHFRALNLQGSNFASLNLTGVQVSQDVFLRNGFKAKGEVSLSGAAIGGQLTCLGGVFENEGGIALNAQDLIVAGGVFLRDGFIARGEVNLGSAKIGGSLECKGAIFENSGGYALYAQGVEVARGVTLSQGFAAKGEVNLSSGSIGGALECNGGTFLNSDGDAIFAQGISIAGGVFLSGGFCANGEVNFNGARIGGQFSCKAGRFENVAGLALVMQEIRVVGHFFWRETLVPSGAIYLSSAHFGTLADDPSSWPSDGRLFLDGMTYDRLAADFADAKRRLAWLAKGDRMGGTFTPQPYTQLAKVLREMGHDRDAREVLIAKERKLAAERIAEDRQRSQELWAGKEGVQGDIGWHWLRRTSFKLWNGLARRLVGYGYAPQFAFYWMVFTVAALTGLYWLGWRFGGMVPNSAVILTSAEWAAAMAESSLAPGRIWAESDVGRHYETFNALIYASDVFIPLIDFGQQTAWTATTANWIGKLAFGLNFLAEGFGWFLTAMGAAAITGIIRRD